MPAKDYTSFAEDVAFMGKYTDLIELSDPSGQGLVAVSAGLQGRVMTSSASGSEGRSYGWINRELFESGDTLEHINVYGGEERFWMGPEGGQYSIFFKKGDEFNLDNWYTPRLIDLEPFEVQELTASSVVFTKKASLVNYSGFQFDLGIERKVETLSPSRVLEELGLKSVNGINTVAYKTTNSLTNLGEQNWQKETGLLSIWMLGMFNPSPATTVVIPFNSGSEEELGIPVNDTYFGKVPEDRLVVKDDVLFFSGDGEYRSKIGLSPRRAKDICGSYDATNGILTIVKYNQPEGVTDYVNSMWEIQDQPYAGDVVNSYNDGPPEPGAKPLGPFYELETSSPALALKSGETGTHIQLTCHFEGDEKALDNIASRLLGVSLLEITSALNPVKE
ncbi:MAG: hypothetical protein RIG77_12125 [Cyclobacteriaceae bacterium]